MGAGIAYVAAASGCTVTLVEPDAGARERAAARIAKDCVRAGDESIAKRITFVQEIGDRSDATLAIEAVPESMELKRSVFAALDRALAADAVLATNTSSLSVGEITAAVSHRERAAGLHFFNPAAAMKLVEVIASDETSDATLERLSDFVKSLGKTDVIAADTPGFIVNRVARPYYLQAMRAYERDVADVAELDALARGAGFRMGPFELMDLIGLDVNLATTLSVYERTGEERLAPVRLQQDMVDAGTLGRKTGKGFYDYAQGPPQAMQLTVDPPEEMDNDEVVVVIGYGSIAQELMQLLEKRYANLSHVESDEVLDTIPLDATIVIDAGSDTADRGDVVRQLDALLGPDTILLADAYVTDISHVAAGLQHGDRLVGYGVLGALAAQHVVELVDSGAVSDDALAVAEELFGAAGKSVVLVGDAPALFLGRVVASIINEAVTAVAEDVATADDVDVAMRLGVNYPIGPVAWGREIGGARLARMLSRLADAEGTKFAPHRSLWVLDVDDEEPVAQ